MRARMVSRAFVAFARSAAAVVSSSGFGIVEAPSIEDGTRRQCAVGLWVVAADVVGRVTAGDDRHGLP